MAVEGRLVGVTLPYDTDSTANDVGGQLYRERFSGGVFARSIAERGSKIRLFSVDDTRTTPVGSVVELREDPGGLFAAFTVADSRDGDAVLALIQSGATAVVHLRPIRDARHGGVLVHTEAALLDVRVIATPRHFIPRAVAERRLRMLELDQEPSW